MTTLSLYACTAGMSMPSKRGLDAERRALARLVGDLGRVQQGLGGDAAAVQAGAAELVLLDQGDRLAQLGGAQRAGVTAAAAAQDDDVVGPLSATGLLVGGASSRDRRYIFGHLFQTRSACRVGAVAI